MKSTETALRHPPQALRRGNFLLSTSRTSKSNFANAMAAAEPAGPAPMMTTSRWEGEFVMIRSWL